MTEVFYIELGDQFDDDRRRIRQDVGTTKPEHFQKAQQGKQLPYANHNPDYQVDLGAILLGAKVGATMVMTMFAT